MMGHSLLAYIDPGSGALLIQAVIASAFGSVIIFRDALWGFFGRFLPGRKQQAADVSVSTKPDSDETEPVLAGTPETKTPS
jgi:hypothetical protein